MSITLNQKFIICLIIFFAPLHVLPVPLRAYLSYAVFYSPSTGPYIETYLSVMGNTVRFTKNSEGKWQSAVEIIITFRQGDTIQYFDKYNLLSPALNDSTGVKPNFIDQKRIQLADGSYDFEISIGDISGSDSSYRYSEQINIMAPADRVFISDIEFIESAQKTVSENVLSKNGYDLVPYISNFFPQSLSGIKFYSEVYNSGKILGEKSPLLLNYFIESYETGKKIESFTRFKKMEAQDVIPLLADLSIGKLPSGNYNLVVEVRDKSNNKMYDKKIFFQRSNSALLSDTLDISSDIASSSFVAGIINKDTLAEYIRCLSPVSQLPERSAAQQIIKEPDLVGMQRFFLTFWLKRNGSDPESAWKHYYAIVQKVNRKYSTYIRKGYETDRGRVYLQYGEPNSITQNEHEPIAYPYEIWHYYKIGDQSNLKFVFINTDLVSNNYELIHSNMIGEIYDPKWQLRIHRSEVPPGNIDADEITPHLGGKSKDIYKNPK